MNHFDLSSPYATAQALRSIYRSGAVPRAAAAMLEQLDAAASVDRDRALAAHAMVNRCMDVLRRLRPRGPRDHGDPPTDDEIEQLFRDAANLLGRGWRNP